MNKNNLSVYTIDFGNVRGVEIAGLHPAIVLRRLNSTVTVIPIKSYTGRMGKYEILLQEGVANLNHTSKVVIHQLTTVDRKKLKRCIGVLPIEKVQEVNKSCQEFLNL